MHTDKPWRAELRGGRTANPGLAGAQPSTPFDKPSIRFDRHRSCSSFSRMSRAEQPLFRATALVAMLCVLALTVFAASPDLHASLHAPAAATDHALPIDDAGHVCAVTLFAQGLTGLLIFCLLLLGRPLAASVVLRATDEIAVARPRYWLVPSHAPPAA
jgi:hypothetical protein